MVLWLTLCQTPYGVVSQSVGRSIGGWSVVGGLSCAALKLGESLSPAIRCQTLSRRVTASRLQRKAFEKDNQEKGWREKKSKKNHGCKREKRRDVSRRLIQAFNSTCDAGWSLRLNRMAGCNSGGGHLIVGTSLALFPDPYTYYMYLQAQRTRSGRRGKNGSVFLRVQGVILTKRV